MIFKVLVVFLLISSLITPREAYQSSDNADKICDKYPSLHLCQLKKDLMGSLAEVNGVLALPLNNLFQYLDNEGHKFEDPEGRMDEERGPRFGRQIPVKKRSEYIRFG